MVNRVFKSNSFKIFALITSFIFSILFTYNFCKILKIQHCMNLIYISSVIIPLFVYLVFFNDIRKNRLICSLTFLFLVLIVPFLFSWTYDYTVDGNSYHKVAIGFMKEGWNTVYESSLDWQEGKDVVQIAPETQIDKWIDHYPKATWTVAAAMYSYTGNIESGKSINFLLMVSMFLLLYSVFSQKFGKFASVVFSSLLSLNPILLSQMFSYYLDGLLGICFIVEFLILLLLDLNDKKSLVLWSLLLFICSIFVNLKFTGLLYSGILAAVFYFYWLFKDRGKFWSTFKYITLRFFTVFMVAICFIGVNSYVKNTIEHHNPLYPLIGKDKVDIITTMQPKAFGSLNSFQKFAWSLFSRTENVTYFSGDPKVKLPFKLYRTELSTVYESSDIRIGGFGPFYAASFIVGLVFLIYSFVYMIKNKNKTFKYFLIAVISIVTSCIAVGEGWWARYVPQFYCIPIIGLISLEYSFKNKIRYILQIMLCCILLVNVGCFIYSYPQKFRDFKCTRNELVEFGNLGVVKLNFSSSNNPFGLYFNLKDYNIKYKFVPISDDEDVRWIYSWRVRVKLND